MQLTIVVNTLDELDAFAAGLLQSMGKNVLDQVLSLAAPPGAPSALAALTLEPQSLIKGTYRLTDIREALQRVAAAQGVDAAMALLERFHAVRISDLAPTQHGPFLLACQPPAELAA